MKHRKINEWKIKEQVRHRAVIFRLDCANNSFEDHVKIQILYQQVQGDTWDFAFLTCSQVMLLLIYGPHCEYQGIKDARRYSKEKEKDSGAEDKMSENFSKLLKDIKPQIQEDLQILQAIT